MADRRPIMNAARRKHLRTLERRLNYLSEVINEPNSPGSNQWDRCEMAALQFAIRVINEHHQPAPAESSAP